jgi:hypothetical protein
VRTYVPAKQYHDIDAVIGIINRLGPADMWDDLSPIWYRPQVEKGRMYKPRKLLQVVGHTPVEAIEKKLADSGFECVSFSYDNPQPEPTQEEAHEDSSDADFTGICISMPRSLFTEQNLTNLHSIVEAKGSLIRKALGAANLPIEISDCKIGFPWFMADPTPDELKAYESFVCRLCDMARNQKRVTAKEKETDNEKYAFRCFLLRLGFIGDEFKVARKILLRNFSGSSAFKSAPSAKEVQS